MARFKNSLIFAERAGARVVLLNSLVDTLTLCGFHAFDLGTQIDSQPAPLEFDKVLQIHLRRTAAVAT